MNCPESGTEVMAGEFYVCQTCMKKLRMTEYSGFMDREPLVVPAHPQQEKSNMQIRA